METIIVPRESTDIIILSLLMLINRAEVPIQDYDEEDDEELKNKLQKKTKLV